ncbi:MAG: DODA-type extradiol aromatic ring-opening family dioxygenase [Waterburya sp.]
MSQLPTLFISHGSPDLPLRPSPTRDFLTQLGKQLKKPKSILVISAHYNTIHPIVSAATQPKTIHDYGGFPSKLSSLNYPAAGDPQLAHQINNLLLEFGFTCEIVTNRGLDHGAWDPLIIMYPDADIPVTQLSIQPAQDPAYHLRLGQAIAPLREEGVLILASGTATHNLWEMDSVFDASPPSWVSDFAEWLNRKVIAGDREALINYQQLAPYAKQNHPTSEHLLPLFVALGASGERAKVTQLHSSYTYGVFSMAAFSSCICVKETLGSADERNSRTFNN